LQQNVTKVRVVNI